MRTITTIAMLAASVALAYMSIVLGARFVQDFVNDVDPATSLALAIMCAVTFALNAGFNIPTAIRLLTRD